MPRLWDDTIEAHRHHVTEAILEATAGLVATRGLRSVTMSEIAEQAGIGRATLYKYFSDVESILETWHERQIDSHLQQLSEIASRADAPGERLAAVLETYAVISHRARSHQEPDLARILHRHDHVSKAQRRVRNMIRALIKEAAATGDVRDDAPADELATFCLHALDAAGELRSQAAVRRLVRIVVSTLRAEQHV